MSSLHQSAFVLVKDIAVGARVTGFHFQGGQNRLNVANDSPPLRCFFGIRRCFALAFSCRDGSGYSLHATAKYRDYNRSIILIFQFQLMDESSEEHERREAMIAMYNSLKDALKVMAEINLKVSMDLVIYAVLRLF